MLKMAVLKNKNEMGRKLSTSSSNVTLSLGTSARSNLSAISTSNATMSARKTGLGTEEKLNSTVKLNTVLQVKKILRVYVDPDTKTKYIDREAAEELSLIGKIRKLLISKEVKYQITNDIINRITSKKGPVTIEIEYVELPPKEKQTCRVYYYDRYRYIDRSAAYSMGLIDVKEFNSSSERYEISEKEYEKIRSKYNLEFFNIRLVEEEKLKEETLTL